MANFLERARAVPLRAAPRVAAHLLRRRWQALRAPRRPRELSDGELLRALRPPLSSASPGEVAAHFKRPERPRLLRPPAELGAEARKRLLRQAEASLAHRFDLLGSGPTDLGERIDWRRDFKSGHAWPAAHHTRLRIVDLDAGFDVKVPWELSRFHHGVTLAQAYALTGQEGYAGEFAAQVASWLAENPPEFGPNWANAMEAAIRAANWLAAYDLLAASPSLPPEFHLALLKSLLAHGRYIAAHLEAGWPGSNHYLADLCGLAWLGARLPEFREADGWLRAGLAGLTRELERQVYADGADYEASTGYHCLVTEMVLWTGIACRAGEVSFPPFVAARLEKMLEVLAGLLKPDGALPAFGDLDSGRWLALESDRDCLPSGQDPQGLLALGAAFFGRADWLEAAGERWEGAAWVAERLKTQGSSHKGQGASPSTLPPPPSPLHPLPSTPLAPHPWPSASRAFPDAGWYAMRAGDGYLAVDAGENGADGWGLHAHNDTLGFELAVGGRSLLVDPGSYAYTGDYRARNLFRATAAHNTLAVDGAEINRIPERDVFRLENDAQVRVLRWESGEAHDRLVAEHTGYLRLGALHRREFYFDKERGFWLLRDWVLPAAAPGGAERREHGIEIFFHFAPLPVALDGPAARTTCETGVNLLVLPVRGPALEVSQSDGWISPRYGVRQAAPVVRYAAQARLPVEFAFVLWPFEAGRGVQLNARTYDEIRAEAESMLDQAPG